MLHLLAHAKDGRFVTVGDCGIAEAGEALPPDAECAWVDIEKPTSEELAWLAQRYRFHPLAIEDCTHFDQRAKLEEYADHLFLVVHGLRVPEPRLVEIYELHCFITANAVVTVHDGPIESIGNLRTRFGRDRLQLPRQPEFLLYRILDGVMDRNPAALETLWTEIELLDEKVLRQARTEHVERVHELQQELNEIRHVIHPQREILTGIMNGRYDYFSDKSAVYFRDVTDHLHQLEEFVEELRESLASIRDSYFAVSAHRTNDAMRRLTSFSVVFLPLTFITGFFGMNFEHIPWKSDFLFWLTVGSVALLPVGMFAWLVRKDQA